MEPASVAATYQLGLAYVAAGSRADARRTLAAALRLDPREPSIAVDLRRASR